MWQWFKKIIGYKNTKFDRQFTHLPFVTKVWAWQQSEILCNRVYIKEADVAFSSVFPKLVCRQVMKTINQVIEYTHDFIQYGRDHWPTSEQVFKTMKDDCDGQSIAMWYLLISAGIPADQIGMCYLKGIGKKDNRGHMIAVWHDPKLEDDFWVLDNKFLTKKMIKASKLFPIKRNGRIFNPIYGFNTKDTWIYKEIK